MTNWKKNIITIALSLTLSAALVSGIETISKAAMAVILITNVLGLVLIPIMFAVGEKLYKTKSPYWLTVPLSIIQLAALLYAGYPYVFAFSLVMSVIVITVYQSAKPKEEN